MPSSAQCIQIATLAAYLGRRDYCASIAEELAQDILRLHRCGQTLGDLYAAEKTYQSARRRGRIVSLERSCEELVHKLVRGLDLKASVRFGKVGAERPETMAIYIEDPVGTRSFYLGGRQ